MAEKYFNRQEAEKLLLTIEPWLKEARQQKQAVESLQTDIAKASAKVMMLGGSLPPLGELSRKKSEQEKTSQVLLETIKRIQETGCVVKDLDIGLIDFPSMRGGEEVYLCWKLGEERIGFWHGIDEGFTGRKPLEKSGDEPTPPPQQRIQ
jgi:hypothetical protein